MSNSWIEPYDLFVSYAHSDNADGLVTELVRIVAEQHQAFSPSEPLKVFFDSDSIRAGADWEKEIRTGLRQSKIMLAVVSPAYFESEWCRKEWDEFRIINAAKTYPGDPLTPVFVAAPQDLGANITDEIREWWDGITKYQGIELHPFWPDGVNKLRENEVLERIGRSRENIHYRADLGKQLAGVPRNLTERNPNFTGRVDQLRLLRSHLIDSQIAGICAVNGIGGMGKTSLAREYAYLFRPDYLGGQFEISLEQIADTEVLKAELVRLATGYLQANIPENVSPEKQHQLAIDAFNTLPPEKNALLILDNLNEEEAELVSQFARVLPSREKVHVIVTTRLGERSLGQLRTVEVDSLPPDDALDLLFRYRQYAFRHDDPEYLRARAGKLAPLSDLVIPPNQEWKAALSIANQLGRHSLAVALVGAFLGKYPDVSYQQFLEDMIEDGIGLALNDVGSDEKVKNVLQLPETMIGPLFEKSLERLPPLALRILQYAALLPVDSIPTIWLEGLIQQEGSWQDAFASRRRRPTLWAEVLQDLNDLGYLKGDDIRQMHQVVNAVVAARSTEDELTPIEDSLLKYLARRGGPLEHGEPSRSRRSEAKALRLVCLERRDSMDLNVAELGGICGTILLDYTGLRLATEMFEVMSGICQRSLEVAPCDQRAVRDLSVSYNTLGDVSVQAGELVTARRFYEQALELREQLRKQDPTSAQAVRDLSVYYDKLGDVSVQFGDLSAARCYYEQDLKLSEQLRKQDPTSARALRDLVVSHVKLSNVSELTEDWTAAIAHLEKAVEIFESLHAEGRLAPVDQPYIEQWKNKIAELRKKT